MGAAEPPETGIHVIVVGAGFGGLATAIECVRHGHSVSVYESFAVPKILGDIIFFGRNAGRQMHRWSDGAVTRRLRPLSIDTGDYGFRINKWTGEHIVTQPTERQYEDEPSFNGHRGEMHAAVFEYARDDLGIPIHLGERVEEYFETEEHAGIVLKSGERVCGDVVIGADGIRSRAREVVLGQTDKPKSSGYSVWRTWFSTEEMLADSRTRDFCANGDTSNVWIGPHSHMLFFTLKGGKECCWLLSHKDECEIGDAWSFPARVEDPLRAVAGWDPVCTAIIEKTSYVVDWKLIYRDPLPTWVSERGRIAVIGDAAHPILPTSAQGAAQALEDGVTIAVCLKKAGKDSVPVALKSFQEIRYERVKRVQKKGEDTRDLWHMTDWDKVKKDPTTVSFPREQWVFEHDAEKHADEVFSEVAKQFST